MRYFIGVTLLALLVANVSSGQYAHKTLIAHRGASAYAPEHTLAAYRLAIEQNADFVEQDLQITKDGVLVCLHDLTLERTTDVEEVFPNRYTKESEDGHEVKHWYVADFTLAEIRKLDSGSWFDAKFKGSKVLTWQEAIDFIRGKAGLYPETKEPEIYGKRGFDMERLVLETLRKNSLVDPNSKTPVIIQSFSPDSLQRLRQYKSRLPQILLINDAKSAWLTAEGMTRVAGFANGIGPDKEIISGKPAIVAMAHKAGLSVTPYTFRKSSLGQFKTIREEMSFFLRQLDVDALFTDNPDMFPR